MIPVKERIKQSQILMKVFYRLRFYIYGNKYLNKGSGNEVIMFGALLRKNSIEINGSNNRIEIGDSTQVSGCRFVLSGDNHTLRIGNKGSVNECNFFFEDHNCSILIGNHFRMYKNGEISAVEPYSKVEIGNHCLFSVHIDIRNTDSHSIIDLATGKRINPGRNIKIEDKVWIGAYVQILKGVTIGSHSIIGIRSLVTKDIPEYSLAAGVPARVMKTNIDWKYERI